ncbi:MAG: tetratricopeptide repeat protein [Candidatus Heimdallarchaeota archaeon]|nr:MAG: tetratricopeptide repeat protein [Candidatus Heimdallarchaeota archaeon]
MNNSEELIQIKELIKKGQYTKANQLLEQIAEDDKLEGQYLKSLVLCKLGDFENSLALAKETFQQYQEIGKELHSVDALIVQIEGLWRLGRPDESLEIINQGEQIIGTYKEESTSASQQKATLIFHKGVVFYTKGNFELALKFHKKSLALREEMGNSQDIATSLNGLGHVLFMKGELDQALECFQRCLVLREVIGNPQEVAEPLNNIGSINLLRGNLKQALYYFKRSLALLEQLGNPQHIARSRSNIGLIHYLKGDIEQALEPLEQGLRMFKKLGNPVDIAKSLNSIGLIYAQKGDLQQALESLQQGLNLFEELENPLEISSALFRLISISIDSREIEKANHYLYRLQQINEQNLDNKMISQHYRIAKALTLKTGKRISEKAEAQELLQQVVSEEIVNHDLTVRAMLNLCEILLDELKVYGDTDVFNQVKTLLTGIFNIALQQQAAQLIVQSHLLQAKFALIEGNANAADDLLEQARINAEERGLTQLILQINTEQEILHNEVDKWLELFARNAPIKERVEQTRLGEYIAHAIRYLPET